MTSKPRYLQPGTVLIAALVIVALLPALQMWQWVSHSWVPLPFWDEWHTPGSQFESWKRGTLTLGEMFSQHNESRLFFPRLLYFFLALFGGWDVRDAMRALFLAVCAFSLLLFHLLRRTPGATPISSLVACTVMTFTCFAPVQVANFLYGIEIEPLIPGFALLAIVAVNLTGVTLRTKTLLNIALAFVATYSFANGMLVWALGWPLPSPNDQTTRRNRILWSALYLAIGTISIGCYFIGYHRPAYHPPFVSLRARFWDLLHYIVLWTGNYFASDLVGPFALGICALIFFAGLAGYALWTGWRRGDWRTFYPWLLLGAFTLGTATITALGRLGFGLEQALDNRYVAFSRFFYVALFGLCFAIYAARVRTAAPVPRTFLLTSAGWGLILYAVLWGGSFQKFATVPAQHRKLRLRLLQALRWVEPIPDNPDLKLILPFPEVLRTRALFLEKEGVLRLHFVHGALAAAVQRPPPPSDSSHGVLEMTDFQSGGNVRIKGWAWLPEKRRAANLVVIGSEDAARNFKPLTVIAVGIKRPDLRGLARDDQVCRAGFDQTIELTNLPQGAEKLSGWAIDLESEQAWPLATAPTLEGNAPRR